MGFRFPFGRLARGLEARRRSRVGSDQDQLAGQLRSCVRRRGCGVRRIECPGRGVERSSSANPHLEIPPRGRDFGGDAAFRSEGLSEPVEEEGRAPFQNVLRVVRAASFVVVPEDVREFTSRPSSVIVADDEFGEQSAGESRE